MTNYSSLTKVAISRFVVETSTFLNLRNFNTFLKKKHFMEMYILLDSKFHLLGKASSKENLTPKLLRPEPMKRSDRELGPTLESNKQISHVTNYSLSDRLIPA